MAQATQSNICSQCKSITSTLDGLKALTSEKGYEIKFENGYIDYDGMPSFGSLSRAAQQCRLCRLLSETCRNLRTHFYLCAQLESVFQENNDITDYPLHGQKLRGFYIKPILDLDDRYPNLQEQISWFKSHLGIRGDCHALLENNILNTKECLGAQFRYYSMDGLGFPYFGT